jgi:S-DNA-T family DNA segregation ATPase FtsK/SpoIIIE
LQISLIIQDPTIVGKLGSNFSLALLNYFGYFAYVFLLFFLYPIYQAVFKKEDYVSILISLLVLTLFVFSSLILQSIISDLGKIGNILVGDLGPYIGNAGLLIFVLIGYAISALVFIDNNEVKMPLLRLPNLKPNIKNPFSKNDFDTKVNTVSKTNKRKTEAKTESNKEAQKEQTVKVKEEGNTAEITIEEVIEQAVPSVSNAKDEISEVVIEEVKDTAPIIEEPVVETHNNLIVDELEENKKLLDEIELGDTEKPKDFILPPSKFFQEGPKDKKSKVSESYIDKKIEDLLDKLSMFKIDGDVVRTYTGPVVTTFEFKPAPNVKVSKILNLQDDLAMALKAQTIRIQAPIPGKDVVGIEVPNDDVQTIYLKEMLDSELFQNAKSPLTIILGKDIVGKPFITDLKKLPHLLIAGTTGSGKSVGINSMILSLLYKNSPDNLKLVMIDPKMLEFSMYNDIPHLLTPVITKAGDAINALSNMVAEMERRYTLMSQTKTKNIENYNEKAKKEGYDAFPYIVVVIDELADLMMTSGKDVEYSIARLAQMARASGIHLIVATQRPSVDVVTGLIKANLPSRLSYKVGQKVDSKIILDSMGAESLLGRGDMLFTPPGMSGLVRIHAPWSSEDEIEKVVDFLKDQREVQYDMNFIKDKSVSSSSDESILDMNDLDELYEEAKMIVLNEKKTSISYIQRKLRIGYNRAATIVEQLEHTGVLSEANTKGNREILL